MYIYAYYKLAHSSVILMVYLKKLMLHVISLLMILLFNGIMMLYMMEILMLTLNPMM